MCSQENIAAIYGSSIINKKKRRANPKSSLHKELTIFAIDEEKSPELFPVTTPDEKARSKSKISSTGFKGTRSIGENRYKPNNSRRRKRPMLNPHLYYAF